MTETPQENSNHSAGASSESFGDIPNPSAASRRLRPEQRKETHTISVHDAAKMFEAAGVARTERSIINWCWQNRQGLARLDSYFDPNDRKYYITQASIELAIKEELSKGQQKAPPDTPKPEGDVPKASETSRPGDDPIRESGSQTLDELKKKVLDLTITNGVKDMYIQKLHEERSAFALEREKYVNQLVAASREVGELTTRLMQLEGPRSANRDQSQAVSDADPLLGEP